MKIQDKQKIWYAIFAGALLAFTSVSFVSTLHAQNGVGSQVQPNVPYNIAEGPGPVALRTTVPLSSANAALLRANLGGSLLALSGSNPASAGALIISSSAQPLYTLSGSGYIANGWVMNQIVITSTSMKIYTGGTSALFLRGLTSGSTILSSGTFP